MKPKDKRGGKRPRCGRKLNSGKYGEQTVPIRVPISMVEQVMLMLRYKLHYKKENKHVWNFGKPN